VEAAILARGGGPRLTMAPADILVK
jgi:hypothetical protein